MVTPATTDLTSARTGNYPSHPLWGALVEQLRVR